MRSWIKFFTNLSIVTRLGLSFTILILMVLVLWVVSTIARNIEATADKDYEQATAELARINTVQIEFLRAQEDQANFLLRYEHLRHEATVEQYYDPFMARIATISTLTTDLQNNYEQSPEDRESLTTIINTTQDYETTFSALVNTSFPERTALLEQIHENLEYIDELYSPTINGIVYANVEELESHLAQYSNASEPGSTSLREFSLRQSLFVTEVRTASGNLREALVAENHPIKLRITLEHLDELDAQFSRLEELDRDMAVEVDSLRHSTGRIAPAVQAIIQSQNEVTRNARAREEEASRTASGIYLAAVILALLVGMGFIFLSFQHIARPIVSLKHTAQRMADGDYSQPAKAGTWDEIGQLATALNEMVARIQQREKELRDLNRSLEKRVLERTYELESAVQHAQEANRLKDEFLATMSHELRTPLNAIIGFQGILTMSGKLDEKSQFMVERTRLNATRLLNLINDILDLSRMEAGRLTLVASPLSLRHIVQKVRSQIEVLAAEKDLELTARVDESVPATVYMDEDAISKILMNLMANAVKFTKEGHVALNVKAADSRLIIEMQDTGIGIPAHMQDIIFDRFRQVDGSYAREFGGTGLGLAIAQELCHAMNGTIRVASELGQGSLFTVELPLVTDPQAVEAAAS